GFGSGCEDEDVRNSPAGIFGGNCQSGRAYNTAQASGNRGLLLFTYLFNLKPIMQTSTEWPRLLAPKKQRPRAKGQEPIAAFLTYCFHPPKVHKSKAQEYRSNANRLPTGPDDGWCDSGQSCALRRCEAA